MEFDSQELVFYPSDQEQGLVGEGAVYSVCESGWLLGRVQDAKQWIDSIDPSVCPPGEMRQSLIMRKERDAAVLNKMAEMLIPHAAEMLPKELADMLKNTDS